MENSSPPISLPLSLSFTLPLSYKLFIGPAEHFGPVSVHAHAQSAGHGTTELTVGLRTRFVGGQSRPLIWLLGIFLSLLLFCITITILCVLFLSSDKE